MSNYDDTVYVILFFVGGILMKRMFAVLVVAVFFIGSTFSFASTEMLLNDKSLYFMVEKYNGEKLLKNLASFGEIDFVKFLGSDTPLKLETEIEIDCSEDNFIKRDIKILSEVSEKDLYEKAEVKIYNEDKYIATLEAIVDGEVLSIRLPELYEKYLTIDLGNLTELYEKFGMPEEELKALEESNKLEDELEALLVLSEDEEKTLTDLIIRCGLCLNNLVKNEYFIRDKEAIVSYDDKFFTCDSISLEIPQRELVKVVKEIWGEVKSDEKVVKLFEEKLAGFYEIYQDELVEEELPTMTEIIEVLDEMFVALEEMYGPEYENGRIVSKIYFDGDYDIIKREIGIKNESADYRSMIEFVMLDEYYAIKGEDFSLEDRVLVKENITTHQFSYEYLTTDYDFDENYNLITNEVLEKEEFAINVEKIGEQALRFWMDIDEFSRIEMLLSTKKLNENSAELNFDMRVIEKADPSLQSILPMKDNEVSCKMKMVVTQNHKLLKEDLSKMELNINKMSLEALEKEWTDNQEKIIERGEKLYEALFPELIAAQQEMMEENQRMLEETNRAIEELRML